jgi:hypothetical protein
MTIADKIAFVVLVILIGLTLYGIVAGRQR